MSASWRGAGFICVITGCARSFFKDLANELVPVHVFAGNGHEQFARLDRARINGETGGFDPGQFRFEHLAGAAQARDLA